MEEFRQAILSLSRYTQQHPIQCVSDSNSNHPSTSPPTDDLDFSLRSSLVLPPSPPPPSASQQQQQQQQQQPSLVLSSSSPMQSNSTQFHGLHEHSLELLNLDSTPVDDLTRQRVYHTISTLSTNEDMLRSLFNGIDFNGTGYIDYSEFLAACLARKEGLKREYAELIFEL